MGRLAAFSYREIVKRLKQLGFEFHRQAAGSHEIWLNPTTNRYTTIPNHPGDMPEGTLRHPQAGGRRPGKVLAEEVTTIAAKEKPRQAIRRAGWLGGYIVPFEPGTLNCSSSPEAGRR